MTVDPRDDAVLLLKKMRRIKIVGVLLFAWNFLFGVYWAVIDAKFFSVVSFFAAAACVHSYLSIRHSEKRLKALL